MADRKVLVKYYPPDFDFEVLQKKKRVLNKAKELQYGKKRRQTGMSKIMNVRMMFPFTLQCASCREFVYVGTKFNSRVERVQGEDYLGIAKWRFYGRCPNCRGEICFKTDPKNGDYVLEWGGTRTYDPMKDQQLAEERLKKKRYKEILCNMKTKAITRYTNRQFFRGLPEEELEGDRMKQVEAKTYSVQSELAAVEQLEELRKMNRRLVDREAATEQALQFLKQNEVNLEPGESWEEYERTELMKFMETQRELRLRQEGETDDDDEEEDAGGREGQHCSGSTSSASACSALPSSAPVVTPHSSGDLATSALDSPRSFSPSGRNTKGGSIGSRGRSSSDVSTVASNDNRDKCGQEGHCSDGRLSTKPGVRTAVPGSSAAASSMFMLTAVTGNVPAFVVKKKKNGPESVSDMFGCYASSPSSEEDKDVEPAEETPKGRVRQAPEQKD